MLTNRNKGTIYATFEHLDRFINQKHSAVIGNNNWDLRAYLNTDNDEKEKYLGISLRCNEDTYNNLWSCNASVHFTLKNEDDGTILNFNKQFTRVDNSIELPKFKKCDALGNNVEIEVKITVKSSDGFYKVVLEKFNKPKENLTDVVLLVEGKKVHVGKQVLAMHSKYFHTLFYPDSKENTKSEIPIEDVVHSEFIDLLNFIYPSHKQIHWNEVEHILKLADRFEVWSVMEKFESFLINQDGDADCVDIIEKLIYAEKYKLAALQDKCCDMLESMQDVFYLLEDERLVKLGDDTRDLLLRRLAKILKDCKDN